MPGSTQSSMLSDRTRITLTPALLPRLPRDPKIPGCEETGRGQRIPREPEPKGLGTQREATWLESWPWLPLTL